MFGVLKYTVFYQNLPDFKNLEGFGGRHKKSPAVGREIFQKI
jgi:hypothetical protein